DYEGFESLSISEYEGVASVIEKAEFVEQHGELGCLVYRTIADDLAEAARMMEEDYIGEYRSTADYAEELITETTPTLPEQLLYYMDWERLARDMELNSEFHSIETGFEQVHIFVVS
ncbi:MAG: antirestriction protein ArdA, partial [Bacteroidota bacterium]